MASSSFKSSTRRSSITPSDSGSSSRPRRSRSLTRLPPEVDEFAYGTPKSKFVNKTRGSGLFPEISLDDLADELFYGRSESEKLDDESSGSRIGRTSSRNCDTRRFSMDTEASRRRGRSVSKKGTSSGNGSENGNGKREMRRSVSVVRRRNNDLETDTKKSNVSTKLRNSDNGSFQQPSDDNKNRSRQLRRSVSVMRHRRDDLESDPEKSTGSSKLRNFDGGNYQYPSKNYEKGTRQLRRSVSVVRHRRGDFESDSDTTCGSNKLKNSDSDNMRHPSVKQMNPRVLRRTMSQKDLLQFSDNYSSHSSLTDDDRDVHSHKNGLEKTIKTVFSQEKAGHPTIEGNENVLYEAMRNEVRHAVHEIRTELEKAMVKAPPTTICDDISANVSNVSAVAEIRRSYTTELEKSEKRKQELLAELEAEEQHGYELTSIVRELLPASKQASPALKSRSRRRSNDKTRMSRCLTEEAERYFEDFLSNVEDTDISSFDGDKSDTSSVIGSSVKMKDSSVTYNAISEVHEILSNGTSPLPGSSVAYNALSDVHEILANGTSPPPETSVAYNTISEVREILANATSLPAETDGVFLPWLEWETSNDATPFPRKTKEENGRAGSTTLSNLGSWSSECNGSLCAISNSDAANKLLLEDNSVQKSCSTVTTEERSSFDLNEYMELRRDEDFLFETLKQRWRIESGGLILCRKSCWPFF